MSIKFVIDIFHGPIWGLFYLYISWTGMFDIFTYLYTLKTMVCNYSPMPRLSAAGGIEDMAYLGNYCIRTTMAPCQNLS